MLRWLPWIVLLVLGCASCGSADSEEDAEPASATRPRLVGKVASVHRGDDFVLVETFGEVQLGRDLLLTTHGPEGRAGSLKVSGERLGRFAAADIHGGTVAVGDAVYARPMPGEEADETPEPPIPAAAPPAAGP